MTPEAMLAEIHATFDERSAAFLSVAFSDPEVRFVTDLGGRLDRDGELRGLTARQAGWLEAIHASMRAQISQATAWVPAAERRLPDARNYDLAQPGLGRVIPTHRIGPARPQTGARRC